MGEKGVGSGIGVEVRWIGEEWEWIGGVRRERGMMLREGGVEVIGSVEMDKGGEGMVMKVGEGKG